MKKSLLLQVMTHIVALVIGLGVGYFSWNTPASQDISTPTCTTKPAPTDQLTPKGGDDLAEPPKENSPIVDNTSEETAVEKKEEKEVLPAKPIDPKPVASGNLKRVNMGISDKKIGEILSSIAQNLEDKRLEYRSDLLQDCSGIFHQMKDSLQSRLPALRESSEYQYPSSKSVRNTRQIADWFYKNKNLLIVQDAMASRNSIRPGSVMFYGKSNKTFKNIDIDLLTDRANNYTSNGAIMHIAVVTAVSTDAEGNVIDYTIMHGRNPRNHASRTGSKAEQSTRTKGLPPFGNWSQQLVAIANIATPR